MIRLFTALSLPDELRPRLAALGSGIDGARWVEPENLHITLRFIGEVSEPVAEDVASALDTVSGPAFDVCLNGAGQFASRGRARAAHGGHATPARLRALPAPSLGAHTATCAPSSTTRPSDGV